MKLRFFFYSIILLLCSFPAYTQNAMAENEANAQPAVASSSNSATTANKLVGSSIPKSSDLLQRGAKGIVYCLCLLIVAYALKRRVKGTTSTDSANPINIVARKNLGQRCSLVLVEIGGKRFLLSHSLDCLSLISELDEPNYLDTKALPAEKVDSFENNLNLAVNG